MNWKGNETKSLWPIMGLCYHFHGGTKEDHEKPPESQPLDQEENLESPYYKVEVFTTQLQCSVTLVVLVLQYEYSNSSPTAAGKTTACKTKALWEIKDYGNNGR
jgi:hypothetical protein